MKGIVLAGTHSGSGKTTVTLGLMAALRKKGLTVQPFKAGPDYIDAGLHRLITGRPSRNLDLWICGAGYVRDCFRRHSSAADISVVEGVMGLYDGERSTASLSKLLGLKVVLVVDAYGMAETAGAIVKGFRENDRELEFAGVVFNRVASEKHFKRLKESVRDMPVLGYLPRNSDFELPHRHLGLVTAEEAPVSKENIERLVDAVTAHIDLGGIVDAASPLSSARVSDASAPAAEPTRVTIAVAYDKAFSFYYEDNLDLLRESGAELVFFSPLSDEALPENIGGVYIGGGYPELYAERLSENLSMKESVRRWAGSGGVLYAECGGLMYLSAGIRGFDGRLHEMSGVFPFETAMRKGRSRLGYREVELAEDCILGKKGEILRGHEFHYSEITDFGTPEPSMRYILKDGSGDSLGTEGYGLKNVIASYVHIHFGGNPATAGEFAGSCRKER